MMKTLLLLIAASLCFAQTEEKPGPKYYRLDFVVKELESGKVQNAKTYSIYANTLSGGKAMVRSGGKVAVSTSANQYTYLDVGVNIDCRLQFETSTELGLQVAAEISNLTQATPAPVIDQTKWDSNVVVALKKPTTIFSSESPASKRTTQLELTVTPLQ
jgi:hypothetical protein